MTDGWAKLWRCMIDDRVWTLKDSWRVVWVTLLAKSDWRAQSWSCPKCGELVPLPAGSFVGGLDRLAELSRVSRMVARGAVRRFTLWGMVEPKSKPRCHVAYVVNNWDKYQGLEPSEVSGENPARTQKEPLNRGEAKKERTKEPNKGRSSKRAKSKSPTPNQPQQTTLDTPEDDCALLCLRLRTHVTSVAPGASSCSPVAWERTTYMTWRKAALDANKADDLPTLAQLDEALDCLEYEDPRGFSMGTWVHTMDDLIAKCDKIRARGYQDTRAQRVEREMEIPFARPGEDLPQ